MTEPTTEAGRRLLASLLDSRSVKLLAADILAIEADARVLGRTEPSAEVREAVRCWLAGDTKGLDGAMADLAHLVARHGYDPR